MSKAPAPTHPRPDEAAVTDLDRLGGPVVLQKIISRLVAHMANDVMIGFFFAKVNLKRLAALEAAYAQSHLGGRAYNGRDVPKAHGPLPIARGHFARRLQLLRETLAWAQVPTDVQQRWLAHQMALMPQIVGGSQACPGG